MEKIVITDEIAERESLASWAESFKLGTAGYREVMNPDDIDDPTVPFNRTKMALIAEARVRVLTREYGGSKGLTLHVGGEVRAHTREFIDLVSRIYAAHGITVRRRPDGKTCPIWYSSFGTFYEGLTGGDNFTASHSPFFKAGWKPMDEDGKQLVEMARLIAEEVREISRAGTELPLAPADSPLILNDFDVTDAYTDYLKTIVKDSHIRLINEAGEKGFNAFFATLGGSMAGTSSEIFEKMGVPVGDDKLVSYLFAEEDPAFHGIGMVDGVNHGVDPGKWQVYKNIGAQNLLANKRANVVFIWDPDGDRFNMITKAPAEVTDAASDMGLEVEPLPGAPKYVCVYFKPNQIYFMITAWLLEKMKKSGELGEFDWIVMETFPSSRSIAELAERFGVKIFFTPVGFKHFGKAVKAIEDGISSPAAEGDEVTIEDILGQEHDLGRKPRVLIMLEESGGAALGGSEFIKSGNGKNSSLALKEKDGMQIGLLSLVMAAELYQQNSCFASFYMETMKKQKIKNRFYHREDMALYDESITDRTERDNAQKEAKKKKEAILSFFQDLADQIRTGNMESPEVSDILNEKQDFVEFDLLDSIYWTGDGTYLEYPDFWFGIRASGTDAVMRYYMEGADKYQINKINRALMSIE